ncbi:MAG TPA: hypothetical protein VGO93_28720 [Candidatus Xenobia bacterium]
MEAICQDLSTRQAHELARAVRQQVSDKEPTANWEEGLAAVADVPLFGWERFDIGAVLRAQDLLRKDGPPGCMVWALRFVGVAPVSGETIRQAIVRYVGDPRFPIETVTDTLLTHRDALSAQVMRHLWQFPRLRTKLVHRLDECATAEALYAGLTDLVDRVRLEHDNYSRCRKVPRPRSLADLPNRGSQHRFDIAARFQVLARTTAGPGIAHQDRKMLLPPPLTCSSRIWRKSPRFQTVSCRNSGHQKKFQKSG